NDLVGHVACSSNAELERARRDLAAADHELSHRYGKREPARAGAAGVDEQHAVPLDHGGLVRVARYHDTNACSFRVDAELRDIVNRVKRDVAQGNALGRAYLLRPGPEIVVAADRGQRRE